MRAFVLMQFWFYLLGALIFAGELASKKFPFTEEKSQGGHTVKLILHVALLFWAAMILWGGR